MPRATEFRRSLRQLLLVAAAVAVIGLVGGWLFARSDASAAARLLLGEEVATEDESRAEPGPHHRLPTSGPQRGPVACGASDTAPDPGSQVSALAAGVVILHHDPELADDERSVLAALAAEHERILVAPAPDLDAGVVATAWRHRFEPAEVDHAELERFIVGWSGRGPDPAPCS